MKLQLAALALGLVLGAAGRAAQGQALLELVATIVMPDVKGRIDHLAADAKGQRLFVAALGNDTVEVLDTAAHRHVRSLAGFGEPQGLAYLPDLERLYVANGTAARVDLLDGATLSRIKRLEPLGDADNLRYDPLARVVVAGYGKGALRAFRATTGEQVADIRLAGHPESFQLQAHGPLIFANVPTARHIAVVDRTKLAVVATWPVPAAENFPMALDEEGRRLFVGARAPAVLLIFDSDSGKVVGRLPIGGDTDDIFYDAARRRVYAICGEGRVDVVRQQTADRYTPEASVKTAPRARTGLFVPAEDRLYVAAPAAGSSPARVLVYQVR